MNKKRITYILIATLAILTIYISYFSLHGISSNIFLQNNYSCFYEEDCKFRIVDFTVLVNEDTVFSDAVESHHEFGNLTDATFRFGWNRIEVLSDSTSLVAAKNVYLLFPKRYNIVFGNNLYTKNYHGIYIYDNSGR